MADWWQSEYEVDNFEQQLAKLWEDVKPLYQQLHAYVRKRLRDKYGDHVVSAKGPIPAHLLGETLNILFLITLHSGYRTVPQVVVGHDKAVGYVNAVAGPRHSVEGIPISGKPKSTEILINNPLF